jgi:peptidoglycan/xylan/chitin deacetylase (PgdA/CDA1 family)
LSDPRPYVSSVIEESLGLVAGSLEQEFLPQSVVDGVASAMEGAQSGDATSPYLEKDILALLPKIRGASLDRDGFFVRKERWPRASTFAVCLTHDVDNISRPWSHIWKTRGRFSRLDLMGALLGMSLYNNVKLIAAAEDGRGFHSSFYFMSTEYPLAGLRGVCRDIRDRGWEVGLHGDFGTHDSLEKMNEAVSRLSKELGARPTGLREHYLRFDFAKSWPIMEAAGFDYDTTVGNNDRLGFRLGLATPFHPPGADWKPLNLLELPLTLMDTTLWGYLKKTEAEGLADSLRMMAAVEEVEGLFTLLWHQEAVRMKGGRIYWRLIDEMKKRRCFTGSGAEIAAWWRARAVPLMKKGKLISMGAQPPRDLVLRLAIRDGRVPRVRSGLLEKKGDYEYLVHVEDGGFQLEVE